MVGATVAATPVFTQDIGPVLAEGAPVMIVTGTRQSARTATDTVAPIDIVWG